MSSQDRKKMRSLFNDLDYHLMNDAAPSVYLNGIERPEFFEYPFSMLSGLRDVPQSPTHHPEGSVWNHTMLVLDLAAEKKAQAGDARVFMWAALLHDIGKAVKTKVHRGKITSPGHAKAGARMARNFLSGFSDDIRLIRKVTPFVRWHMEVLNFEKDNNSVDFNAITADIDDLALLCLCDRLGRIGADLQNVEEIVNSFLRRAKEIL